MEKDREIKELTDKNKTIQDELDEIRKNTELIQKDMEIKDKNISNLNVQIKYLNEQISNKYNDLANLGDELISKMSEGEKLQLEFTTITESKKKIANQLNSEEQKTIKLENNIAELKESKRLQEETIKILRIQLEKSSLSNKLLKQTINDTKLKLSQNEEEHQEELQELKQLQKKFSIF